MGKKARIRARRLAEAKGAKSILEQLSILNQEIAQSEAELQKLEEGKAKMLEGLMTENAPKGWKQTSLGDILNADQIQAVIDILNRPNLDDIAITKLLKQYLAKFSQQLNAVGVVPDYLAYVLLANKEQLKAMARQSNNKPDDPFQPDHLSRN
jgi:hypothetical protein